MAKYNVKLTDSKKELIEKCVFQQENKTQFKEGGKFSYCYDLNATTSDCIFPIIFLDIPDILPVIQEISIKYHLTKGFRTRSLDRIALFSVDEKAKKLYLLSSTWAQKFCKDVNRPHDRSVTLYLPDMQDLDLNNISFLCIYLTRKNRVLAISKIFRMSLVIFQENQTIKQENDFKLQNTNMGIINETKAESEPNDTKQHDGIDRTINQNDTFEEDNWIIVKSKPKKYKKKLGLDEHLKKNSDVFTAIQTNSQDDDTVSSENRDDKFLIISETQNRLKPKLEKIIEVSESADKNQKNVATPNLIDYNLHNAHKQILINDFNNEFIFSKIVSSNNIYKVQNNTENSSKIIKNKCTSAFNQNQSLDITNCSYFLDKKDLIDYFSQEGKQQMEIFVEQEYDWTTNGINSSVNSDRNRDEEVEDEEEDNVFRDLLTAEDNVGIFEKKIIHYLGLLLKKMQLLQNRIEDGEKAHGEIVEKLDNILKKEKSTDCDSALIPLLCVHG